MGCRCSPELLAVSSAVRSDPEQICRIAEDRCFLRFIGCEMLVCLETIAPFRGRLAEESYTCLPAKRGRSATGSAFWAASRALHTTITGCWAMQRFAPQSLLMLQPIFYSDSRRFGYGSKLSHQGTAGFGPCFHLPGFHFGYLFLNHNSHSWRAGLEGFLPSVCLQRC